MEFSEFAAKVQGWQADKGIYKHSTPLAQALKAVSEVGELADAVIKGDAAGIKDGIGDVMVCLVGVATMRSQSDGVDYVASTSPATCDDRYHVRASVNKTTQEAVAITAAKVSGVAALNTWDHPPEDLIQALQLSVAALVRVATLAGEDLEDCCEAAWLEIKDRKGRMVEGGAFVKDGEPVEAPKSPNPLFQQHFAQQERAFTLINEQVEMEKRRMMNTPTLRDHYAMAALPAIYAENGDVETAATTAYSLAGAMLKERAKWQ